MVAGMDNSLLSTLCSNTWCWDQEQANQFTFKKDGTGELICRFEVNVWIAAYFDWKALDPDSLQKPADLNSSGTSRDAKTVASAEIEITLSKRRIPRLGDVDMHRYTINEQLLKDSAFVPKTYRITLEEGSFVTQHDAERTQSIAGKPFVQKFGFRLAFDKSPYPERADWIKPEGAPDACKFWEWRSFYGRRLSEEHDKAKGSSWWQCTVM